MRWYWFVNIFCTTEKVPLVILVADGVAAIVAVGADVCASWQYCEKSSTFTISTAWNWYGYFKWYFRFPM